MDHLDAEHAKSVERYMLGDLSVSEVEEFERHFFDCPQCSEELRALTIFQENARAVFMEQDLAPIPASATVPKSAASWWGFSPLSFIQRGQRQWAVALAALVIGIFAGYQAFALRQDAQGISAYPLHGLARGEETSVSPAARSKFYTLYFDRTWDGDYASYRAVIRDASSGAEKLTVSITADPSDETIQVLVPSHKLAAGQYLLVMRGADRAGKETEIDSYPFTVRLK
jgi:hypothetical protein